MNPPNRAIRKPNATSEPNCPVPASPEALLKPHIVAKAEDALLADPNSALCGLQALIVYDYLEATNHVPTQEQIREMLREWLSRDIPEPLAVSAASELLAEILWQLRCETMVRGLT
jgi:hypothetical protein